MAAALKAEKEITGSTFLVLIMIADSANDQHNWDIWMSMTTLADKSHVTRQTASTAVAELLEVGWLELIDDHRNRHSGKPSRYRFVFKNGVPGPFNHDLPKKKTALEPAKSISEPVKGFTKRAKKADTNKKELQRTQQQADPSKRGTETQDEIDKATDVINRIIEKKIKHHDWMDEKNRPAFRRNQTKELQRLRPEIYRLLPMSGNSAPAGRLSQIAQHLTNLEIDNSSNIRWEEVPTPTKELTQ